MAVVDNDGRVIAVGQLGNAVKLRQIPIHREDAVSGDESEAGSGRLLQRRLELVHVGVGIPKALRFAEADTVDEAGMVEGVAHDRITLIEETLEETGVGVEA